MILEYEVTLQNFIDFNIDHTFKIKKTAQRRKFLILSLLFLIFTIYFIINNSYIVAIATIVCWVIFASIYRILSSYSMKFMIKKMAKQGKLDASLGSQKLELLNDSVKSTSSISTGEIKYSAIELIYESKELYYIYVGYRHAFIIPNNAFKNEEDKNTFFNILFNKTSVRITKL